jgi:hypothetical protein
MVNSFSKKICFIIFIFFKYTFFKNEISKFSYKNSKTTKPDISISGYNRMVDFNNRSYSLG